MSNIARPTSKIPKQVPKQDQAQATQGQSKIYWKDRPDNPYDKLGGRGKPAGSDDMDYWNFVRAAILWVSNKEYRFVGEPTTRTGNSVGTEAMFVTMDDMYLPYTIRFKMWY